MPRNNDPMTLQERMAYGQQVRESDWASAERRGVDPITGEPLRGSFAAEFLAGPGGRGPVGETEEEYLRRIQHDQYNPFAQSVQRRRIPAESPEQRAARLEDLDRDEYLGSDVRTDLDLPNGGPFDAFLRSVGELPPPGTRVVERTMERVEPEPDWQRVLALEEERQEYLERKEASPRRSTFRWTNANLYSAEEEREQQEFHERFTPLHRELQEAMGLPHTRYSWMEAVRHARDQQTQSLRSQSGETRSIRRHELSPAADGLGETRFIRKYRPMRAMRRREFIPFDEMGVTQEEADLMNEVIQEEELGVTQEEADRMNDRLLERRFPVPGSRYGGSR